MAEGAASPGSVSAGATTFVALTDTPGAFVANRDLVVNTAGTAVEFVQKGVRTVATVAARDALPVLARDAVAVQDDDGSGNPALHVIVNTLATFGAGVAGTDYITYDDFTPLDKHRVYTAEQSYGMTTNAGATGAVNVDFDAVTGPDQLWTLTGNVTSVAFSGGVAGQTYRVWAQQTGANAFTITLTTAQLGDGVTTKVPPGGSYALLNVVRDPGGGYRVVTFDVSQ